MTEKEKMLQGLGYDASDAELTADRKRARMLCHKFNNLEPDQREEATALLKELLQTEGDLYMEQSFRCDYGYNIKVGKNFYANFNCTILDVNTVTIGDNVMFAPNVQIYTATHPVEAAPRVAGVEMGYPITIGDNTWIGGGSIICPGVNIGRNVVIGAGSVVTKDIPDNAVAVGNPCRVIRIIEQDV